jgi:hypothetical protein
MGWRLLFLWANAFWLIGDTNYHILLECSLARISNLHQRGYLINSYYFLIN